MKVPDRIVFDFSLDSPIEPVREYVYMPSGDIVVRTDNEAFWFDPEGHHPKSHLEFKEAEDDHDVLNATILSNKELQVRVAVQAFEHPAVWGILLCDTARHIAAGLAKLRKQSEADLLNEITTIFERELDKPTSVLTGSLTQ